MNPGQYTYGDTGRNILRGPGLIDFDTSFFKNFHFKERATFHSVASFSFFNTPASKKILRYLRDGVFGT